MGKTHVAVGCKCNRYEKYIKQFNWKTLKKPKQFTQTKYDRHQLTTTTELQAQQECGWIKDIHYASAFEKLGAGLRTKWGILYFNSPNRK